MGKSHPSAVSSSCSADPLQGENDKFGENYKRKITSPEMCKLVWWVDNTTQIINRNNELKEEEEGRNGEGGESGGERGENNQRVQTK